MTRACGSCTKCCKLVPVKEIGKAAGQRCVAQRHGGCTIHDKPNYPRSCAAWSCLWLVNDDTGDLRRPDRSHYVIDCLPDYVKLREDSTGTVVEMPVFQIWCDPNYPDAHRDPALRAWLERKAAQRSVLGLVRYDGQRALCLFPPSVSSSGQWIEKGTNLARGEAHSREDVARVLKEATQ